MNNKTPSALIDEYKKLNGAIMPSHKSFINRVIEISELYGQRYTALSTGNSRLTQIFVCYHYRTIYNCRAKLYFQLENGIVRFISCDENHTHDVYLKPNHRKQNTLTQSQRNEIKFKTINGVTPGKIRLQMRLTCSKDVLYGIRRPILEEERNGEMNNLINEMNSWFNWKNIILIDDNKKFNGCYVHHKPVCHTDYAKDLCVIDDTSCTNRYGLPLLVMIAEDENARNQIISFSFLASRTQQNFINYFNSVKEEIGDIRLFVCDRNQTQINAIKIVWPNSLIIYCSIHIGRNIRSFDNELYKMFKKMIYKDINEDEFINECKNYINNNPGSKGANILTKLLSEVEHWLPSIIINYRCLENETSNRVEGFFGSLKNLIDHNIQTLPQIIRAVYIRGERLRVLSVSDKPIIIPSHIISKEDAMKIGTLPLSIILSEYNDINNVGCLQKEYGNCCNINKIYGLPCRHMIIKRIQEDKIPLLSIDDFLPRWRHCNRNDFNQNIDKIEFLRINNDNKDNNWTYSDCIAKFERYFDSAKKCVDIQKILDNTLDKLSSMEYQSGTDQDILPPSNLLISGKPTTHPRNNCESFGAPRKKKKYHCSICGGEGHTAPRCPINRLTSYFSYVFLTYYFYFFIFLSFKKSIFYYQKVFFFLNSKSGSIF